MGADGRVEGRGGGRDNRQAECGIQVKMKMLVGVLWVAACRSLLVGFM